MTEAPFVREAAGGSFERKERVKLDAGVECTQTESTFAESTIVLVECFNRMAISHLFLYVQLSPVVFSMSMYSFVRCLMCGIF